MQINYEEIFTKNNIIKKLLKKLKKKQKKLNRVLSMFNALNEEFNELTTRYETLKKEIQLVNSSNDFVSEVNEQLKHSYEPDDYIALEEKYNGLLRCLKNDVYGPLLVFMEMKKQ
jgi:predicted  nucleic acid-binding Zn-ribbon protein